MIILVIRLGFEPRTHSLEGCCSIQLSYQTILHKNAALRVQCGYDVAKLVNFFYTSKSIYRNKDKPHA